VDNASLVLDRQPGCSPVVYTGVFPSLPLVYGSNGVVNVNCEGFGPYEASVSLGPAPLYSSVSVSAPTKGETLINATAGITSLSGSAISAITITDAGYGYATEVVERAEPEIAAGVATFAGTGAVLSVSLQKVGDGDEAFWTIASVEVVSGGEEYDPSEFVSFSTSDVESSPAEAYIKVTTEAPTISASATGGEGASLAVSLTEVVDYYGASLWSVSSVDVANGGTGHEDGSQVTFTVDDGKTRSPAVATIATGRVEPDVVAGVTSYGGGSGAAFTVYILKNGDVWSVSGVTVENGGSGYAEYSDFVYFSTEDTESYSAYGSIVTDEAGTITSVIVEQGGAYFRSNGIIESIAISDGGEYYKTEGAIDSVVLVSGGQYWRLQGTGVADADTPVVTISSNTGQFATATATVDTSLTSPTFGQITSIDVTNGGDGYRLSGYGWKATVSVQSLHHRAGAELCPELAAYTVHESERIELGDCPNALLSRSYKMAYAVQARYSADVENIENAAHCFSGIYSNNLTIADFGSGDITCTLAPA
jgi:hypothetical protein